MQTQSYTLYELNSLVRSALSAVLAPAYWVQAEVAELRERTHCYMELVQNDAHTHTPIARAKANCWYSTWQQVSRKFQRDTGSTLRPGMQVLLLVSPTFHEAYGFSYTVTDIDPTYTLGDMARRRQEILRQLREEGVFDLQRELTLPLFAQRVAVISSAGAAGYGDFCRQLADNEYGFAFRVWLFESPMQGERVEEGIIAALNAIHARLDDFDVVVIIRGGGATADLSCFDTLALAENVANFPLPIITGIGHERDECVLDSIAHTRVKTPTAAAAFLISHLATVERRLTTARERLTQFALRRLDYERLRLRRLSERVPTLFSLARERQTGRLDTLAQRLHHALTRYYDRQQHHLLLLEQRVAALDPYRLLQRGYSITLHNGHAVRNPHELHVGDVIETRTAGGTVHSTVTECNNNPITPTKQ